VINRNIKVAILLICIPCLSGAAALPNTEKCSAIQDAKKRLNCYDLVSKQTPSESNQPNSLQEKSPSQTQASTEIPVKADRVVLVEAGLVYKSGDIKPVARADFFLLDESLVEIFRNADLKYPMDTDENVPNFRDVIYPQLIVNAFGKIHFAIDQFTSDSAQVRRFKEFHAKAISAIAPHIVHKGTTGFSGKLKLESIKPGVYYLMGMYKTPRGAAVWNSRIDVKNPETTIILDQNNAASVN
jgi:hypothetical protein